MVLKEIKNIYESGLDISPGNWSIYNEVNPSSKHFN